ncbi:uncharacterized protein LOC111322306 [Stylophora pistillata]|uniref:uncharacterized protein LOC111322306 n=1 Tax=Stylophora pistillata TaxID=50429 RepID=UPI000C03909F|nr:uncharacterized protein LOC111322306 [Stylophora pistillata]
MVSTGKILLVFVLLQVALALAKPYESLYDELYRSYKDMRDPSYKAMRDEFPYHRRGAKQCVFGRYRLGYCRAACSSSEKVVDDQLSKCAEGEQCCECLSMSYCTP